MNKSKVVCLLGISAFLAVGCNGITVGTDGSNDGGSDGNCLASATSVNTKLALNAAVSVPAGSGTSSTVAEVFVIRDQSRAVSKLTLLMDQVAPANTVLGGNIQVGIYPDSLIATSGQSQPSQPNLSAAYSDPTTGLRALSTSVSASSIATNLGPQWYDFCFDGASGDGCSGGRGQVTLNANQVYWIVISKAPAAGNVSYIDWYGSNVASPLSAGEIYENGSGFVPVNNPSTNFNFAFKLGC